MSRPARIGLILATLAGLVVAFVVLSPGGDDRPDTASTSAAPPPARTATGSATTPAAPAPPPAPSFETIRVEAGKPVGAIRTITVGRGDRVRIQVTSPDTTDEIHLHGYDLTGELEAGRRVRFSFTATTDGIYEIELEGSGTQIGKLVVEP